MAHAVLRAHEAAGLPSPASQMCIRDSGWAALRAAEGRRVLVSCLQGAGLVCALTLHVLTGRPGTYCAQLVRRARHGALTNASMLELLAALPARPAHQRGAA